MPKTSEKTSEQQNEVIPWLVEENRRDLADQMLLAGSTLDAAELLVGPTDDAVTISMRSHRPAARWRGGRKDQRITITLDSELLFRIDSEVTASHTSRSAVIRSMCRDALDSPLVSALSPSVYEESATRASSTAKSPTVIGRKPGRPKGRQLEEKISLSLDSPLLTRIDAASRDACTSRSAIVRQLCHLTLTRLCCD